MLGALCVSSQAHVIKRRKIARSGTVSRRMSAEVIEDVRMAEEGEKGAKLGHLFSAFKSEAVFNDDNHFTFSSTEQKRVEEMVSEEFNKHIGGDIETPAPVLYREEHATFLRKSLIHLTKNYETLDASRPWLVYWTVHSLALLGETFDDEMITRIVQFLKTCEGEQGGYGGGPGQLPHLATTYAAVMALCTIGTDRAYESINRKTLKSYLKLMKRSDGGFRMHEGGEADIRGAYCALAVASITNLIDQELVDKLDGWLISCQTYEGGFGGVQGCEAHGGYTFCGLAALTLIDKGQLVNLPSLLKWLVFKQMRYEGGFQGRTNKLVDGCYSFWQAASFPVIEMLLKNKGEQYSKCLFDNKALQEFIMICCQEKQGGLRDKPDKKRDLYHTCYTLSGLAIAQHSLNDRKDIIGGESNAVLPTHPIYNIVFSAEQKAKNYFSRLEDV